MFERLVSTHCAPRYEPLTPPSTLHQLPPAPTTSGRAQACCAPLQVTAFYEEGLHYLVSPYHWFAFANIYAFAWIEGRRFKLVYDLIAIISAYTKGDKARCAAPKPAPSARPPACLPT